MHTNQDPWSDLAVDNMWTNLARSTELPAAIMNDIWSTGNRHAQRILARRDDLDDAITDSIVSGGDANLLCEWLRTERPHKQLARIPLNTSGHTHDDDTGERINHHLSWQPHIDNTQLEHIIATASVDTAHVLLSRPDLSVEQRQRVAIAAIIADHQPPGPHPKRSHLITAIGHAPDVWTTIARDAHPGMFATLSEVTLQINDRTLHRAIAERVAELLDAPIEPALASETIRLVRILIRSPHIDPAIYRKLQPHPLLGEIRVQLERRGTLDLDDILTNLADCDPGRGCPHREHTNLISTLDQISQDISLHSETVLAAALAHRDDLDERTYQSVLGRQPLSKPVHQHLLSTGRSDLLADLVSCQGRRSSLLADPGTDVIAVLAERGNETVFTYSNTPERVAAIAGRFAPAIALLTEPALAGHVARRLAALDDAHRDTVYRLLSEWIGDLESLIQTAVDV